MRICVCACMDVFVDARVCVSVCVGGGVGGGSGGGGGVAVLSCSHTSGVDEEACLKGSGMVPRPPKTKQTSDSK